MKKRDTKEVLIFIEGKIEKEINNCQVYNNSSEERQWYKGYLKSKEEDLRLIRECLRIINRLE